ncbi:MAG: DUF805 domain-containing protein [Bacilli bacterium]|nr:DUF805 domain-containing protein [Bacilli bacterium]
MVEGVKEFFTKYATFEGRTDRKTFWLTVLGLFLMGFVIGIVGGFVAAIAGIDNEVASNAISAIVGVATLVPSLALDCRRLHDINKSGWWQLISLVPIVGSIILLVFLCLPAVEEGNNY